MTETNYVGHDRRLEDEEDLNKESPLSIVITGTRLPVLALLTAVGLLVSSIIYAAIWLTKLDDRSHNNTREISQTKTEMQVFMKETTRTLIDVQRTSAVTAAVYEQLLEKHQIKDAQIKRILDNFDKNEKEVQEWHRRVIRLESDVKALKDGHTHD